MGCVLLAASAAPHAWMRAFLDSLAPDGSLQAFGPALWNFLRGVLGLAAGLSLAAGAVGWLRPDWAARLAAFPGGLAGDARFFFRDLAGLRCSRVEILSVGLALAAGGWARLALLCSPLQYDEAYTWVAFAVRSFGAILTDYHLPNNHVLHTLLVRLSALIFGPEPWALRLPAFLAGVMMIPAAFLAARALFSPPAGVLAAGLTAAWPYLIDYSANARGYSLVGLLTLLLFALGPRLLNLRDRFAWGLSALWIALGAFTVPVMLYPAGILFTWLALSALRRDGRRGFVRVVLACAACGLASAAFAFVLYLPILVVSGPQSLFGNPFVRSYDWMEWTAGLRVWLIGIWDSWFLRVPFWLALQVFLFALISLGHELRRGRAMHLLPAAVMFYILALPAQRPELQAKAFYPTLPLLLLCTAAGLDAVLVWLLPRPQENQPPRDRLRGRRWADLFGTLLIVVLALWCLFQARPNLPYLFNGDKGSWQSAAETVAGLYRPGDAVLVTFPFDPQVWYYGMRSGIPFEAFQREDFTRAWVLASKPLAEVLEERGPRENPLRVQDCRLETNIMEIPIYLCERRP